MHDLSLAVVASIENPATQTQLPIPQLNRLLFLEYIPELSTMVSARQSSV
jgi:hypothetical protein